MPSRRLLHYYYYYSYYTYIFSPYCGVCLCIVEEEKSKTKQNRLRMNDRSSEMDGVIYWMTVWVGHCIAHTISTIIQLIVVVVVASRLSFCLSVRELPFENCPLFNCVGTYIVLCIWWWRWWRWWYMLSLSIHLPLPQPISSLYKYRNCIVES